MDVVLSGSSQWLLEATVEGGAGRKPKRSGARPVDRPWSINDVMLQREAASVSVRPRPARCSLLSGELEEREVSFDCRASYWG
jgi:hypothetical protein